MLAFLAMEQLPGSVILVVALLTIFLAAITALKYAVRSNFVRTRAIMTLFFIFIISTLTVSYFEFFFATLPYTIPAGLVGVAVGYFVGVRAAEKKLDTHGLEHYIEHFAHVHIHEIKVLNWWSIINFYSVMGALLLINLVGLTTVIFHNTKPLTLATSAFGAFLIGTIAPYLIHLWSIRPAHHKRSTTSERKNI